MASNIIKKTGKLIWVILLLIMPICMIAACYGAEQSPQECDCCKNGCKDSCSGCGCAECTSCEKTTEPVCGICGKDPCICVDICSICGKDPCICSEPVSGFYTLWAAVSTFNLPATGGEDFRFFAGNTGSGGGHIVINKVFVSNSASANDAVLIMNFSENPPINSEDYWFNNWNEHAGFGNIAGGNYTCSSAGGKHWGIGFNYRYIRQYAYMGFSVWLDDESISRIGDARIENTITNVTVFFADLLSGANPVCTVCGKYPCVCGDVCDICGSNPCICADPEPGQTVRYTYSETGEAFANPIKGFRKDTYLGTWGGVPAVQGEYMTITKHYISYLNLEKSAADTVQTIKNWCNTAWAGVENRNVKVIPRVVLYYPGELDAWPSYFGSGTDPAAKWLNPEFLNHIVKFIAKLGEAWDNDPRVAAVEMGIWGSYGEHHIWPASHPEMIWGNRIPVSVQNVMGSAFIQAFKNKQVLVRYPETFTQFPNAFGYKWDSFAADSDDSGVKMIALNVWRTRMIGGEVAYDIGREDLYGSNPNETLDNNAYTNHVISWIQRTNASYLGWIANYSEDSSLSVRTSNAAKMQKSLGYRFVVQEAVYTQTVNQGETMSLEFKVANTGSAPFYYQWPVEASLLDNNKNPVWKGNINTDIRAWLPGNVYTVKGVFTIPATVQNGSYTLALAVLDPAGNLPSLRFANTNYYSGGRMPLGRIGIGRQPTGTLGSFNSLYSDHSLHYLLE